MLERQKTDKLHIECSCGQELLKVISDIDYYKSEQYDDKVFVNHEFSFAMFKYGQYTTNKEGFWKRFKLIWKYLKTGEMYSDQLILKDDEAKKLADFINKNIESK